MERFDWKNKQDIESKRTHVTKHFEHPTEAGKFIAIQSSGLLHYHDGIDFKDIPDLEKYLSQFDLTKYNCFTQTSHTRCEMVGSDINNFKTVFDEKIFATHNTLYDPHIENVYKYRTSLINNHIPPKLFQIEPTPGGWCNCIFKTI